MMRFGSRDSWQLFRNKMAMTSRNQKALDMCFGYRLGPDASWIHGGSNDEGETLFPPQMQINVVELIFVPTRTPWQNRMSVSQTSKCVCGNTLLISASRSLKICATRVNTMFRNTNIYNCILFENHFKSVILQNCERSALNL